MPSRELGAPVQSFETRLIRLEGVLTGDQDFEYLHLVAGDANGLPSPGHATLYRQEDGNWLVDSSFRVNYRLEYRGAQGGRYEGLEGVFENTIVMTPR